MTTVNLFPARVRWCNPDGTLTPEAYRALTALLIRVGGVLGDNGFDIFSTQSASYVQGNYQMPDTMQDQSISSNTANSSVGNDIAQSMQQDRQEADICQPSQQYSEAPDIYQPASGVSAKILNTFTSITVTNGVITSYV